MACANRLVWGKLHAQMKMQKTSTHGPGQDFGGKATDVTNARAGISRRWPPDYASPRLNCVGNLAQNTKALLFTPNTDALGDSVLPS